MGSVVLLCHYSDFPADHTDFSVYFRACQKKKKKKKQSKATKEHY